jgi:hypothetical protein
MVAFEEMLKYMHGSHHYQTLPIPDYRVIFISDEVLITRLQYCLDVYTITDKYDCPALRAEVVAEFFQLMWHQGHDRGRYHILIPFISEVCGADASFFADGILQLNVALFCDSLSLYEEYAEILHNGLSLNIQQTIEEGALAWQWDDDEDSDYYDYYDDYDEGYRDFY